MLVSLLFHNPTITRLFMTKQRGLFSFREPDFGVFSFHGQHPFVQHCTKPVGQQDLGTCEETPEKSSFLFMDSHPFSRITPCAPQTQPPSSKILSALMLISLRGSGYIPHQHFHSQIAASPSFLHINLRETLQNQLNAGSLVEGHG